MNKGSFDNKNVRMVFSWSLTFRESNASGPNFGGNYVLTRKRARGYMTSVDTNLHGAPFHT